MSASDQTETLKDRVARALAEEVALALDMDGTSVEVVDVTDGVARLQLTGMCSGCPSTILAVIMGLEQELRRLVPAVEYIEAVV